MKGYSFEKLLNVKILQVEKSEGHAEAISNDAKDDAKDGKNMNEAWDSEYGERQFGRAVILQNYRW